MKPLDSRPIAPTLTSRPAVSRRRLLKAMGAVVTLAACGDVTETEVGGVTGNAGERQPDGGDAADSLDSKGLSDTADTVELSADTTETADALDDALDDALGDAATNTGNILPAAISPITPNAEHFVTTCCTTPQLNADTWALSVRDRGTTLATIDWALLQSVKAKTKEHTLECISASPYHGSISNAVWTGLPLTEVLAQVGVAVPTGVSTLKLTGADAYATAVPVADLQRPIWLVWLMNGAPIPTDHGYPARLLLPGRYGTKNPKWLTEIEFLDTDFTGYWEETGWSDDATYKPNTLVRTPTNNSTVNKGVVRVQGTAFAGSDPVIAVDVQVDGGAWSSAALDYAPGADIWTLWHYDWQATVSGSHHLQVRCTTQSGATSLASASTDLSGYDGSMTVTLTVA